MENKNQTPHKRRVHYKGKYPKKFEEKYKEAVSKCPEIAKYYDGEIIYIPSRSLGLHNQVVSCINTNTSDIELVINGERTGEIIHLNANHESEEFSTNDLESKGSFSYPIGAYVAIYCPRLRMAHRSPLIFKEFSSL